MIIWRSKLGKDPKSRTSDIILAVTSGTGFSFKTKISIPYGRITLGFGHTLIEERCTENSGVQ
jgi:hypothetical protein